MEAQPGMSRLPQLPLVPIVAGVALIALAYLGFTTARYVVHHYQLREEESQLRAEIAELQTEQQQLEAVRDYLASDEYVEDVARRVLGLVKPGETLVIVSGIDPSPTPAPSATVEPREWWQKLFIPPPVATPTPLAVP